MWVVEHAMYCIVKLGSGPNFKARARPDPRPDFVFVFAKEMMSKSFGYILATFKVEW